jgi:hypothetical protein
VRTKHAAIIETVFSVWSVPRVYKRYGRSLGAVEFQRVTETREWEYKGVREMSQLEIAARSYKLKKN